MPCGVAAAPEPGATVASNRRLWAFPNPATGRTSIRLVAGETELLRADVYDMAGRRVRSLAAGPATAGIREFAWDGCDQSGRALPAGVYFVRAATGAGEATGRVVLTR